MLIIICCVDCNDSPKPEKFWVHRCNSVEKLSQMLKEYKGVEIDAYYFENISGFDVSHEQHDFPINLLEEMMPLLAEYENAPIWFDFKNLNSENAEAAFLELDRLLRKYEIDRSRFIVESHNYKALEIYKRNGFYTSYFVPLHDKVFLRDEEGAGLYFKYLHEGAVEEYKMRCHFR